jgi:hypothetical protein
MVIYHVRLKAGMEIMEWRVAAPNHRKTHREEIAAESDARKKFNQPHKQSRSILLLLVSTP